MLEYNCLYQTLFAITFSNIFSRIWYDFIGTYKSIIFENTWITFGRITSTK